MRVTDALRGEHAAMKPNLRFLREALKDEKLATETFIKASAMALATIIHAHATVEEACLFFKMTKCAPVQHALGEHKEIGLLLGTAAKDGDKASLEKGVSLILGHFKEEERDVFPLAEKMLTPRQLAQLGLDWATMRGIKL